MSSSDFALRLATEPVVLPPSNRSPAKEPAGRCRRRSRRRWPSTSRPTSMTSDESGHRLVVRNGHKPPRTILSGVGPIEVEQPRVDDRRVDENGVRFRFTSQDPAAVPAQDQERSRTWCRGCTSRGSAPARCPTRWCTWGSTARGCRRRRSTRMTEAWQGEYDDWSKRDLSGKHYVYLWADGIYFGCRLTDDRPCVLVLMGATADGTKELIAMVDGQRESETSWTALLLD